MHRLGVLTNHFTEKRLSSSLTHATDRMYFQKHGENDCDRDVVIIGAKRTPIAKAKKGYYKETHPDDLLTAVFNALLQDANLNPALIGDICVGNVNNSLDVLVSRVSQFRSGIPETVPVSSCNRYCSSGLQAVMNIANAIKNGVCDIGIGAGFEMMSQDMADSALKVQSISSQIWDDFPKARDCLLPMGITSENVAAKFGITREQQDAFAALSHKKASEAYRLGYMTAEMIPVAVKIMDNNGVSQTVIVDKDEGFRPDTSIDVLSKLKPAFKQGGSTTAGNSSQVSDGAAGVLLVSRITAAKLGLPVLGIIRAYAVVGVPPDIMGIGPAFAIPEVLKKAGLSIDDIDIFEINEAFASQAVYCVEKLGIPKEKVNPKGGAIAIGHPLGCTGARQIATLLHELKRRRKRALGVVSMCVGTGMGAAAVIEYPGA